MSGITEDEVDDSWVPAIQTPEFARLLSRGRVVMRRGSVTLDLSDPSAWLEREFRGPWLKYLRKHRRLFVKDHPNLKPSDMPVVDRMIEFDYLADQFGNFVRAAGLRLGDDYPVVAKLQQDYASKARLLRADLLGSPKSRRQPQGFAPAQVGVSLYAAIVREARQKLTKQPIDGEAQEVGAGKPLLEGR